MARKVRQIRQKGKAVGCRTRVPGASTTRKVLFARPATENQRVCAAFLWELLERGLTVELGLLVAIEAKQLAV